MIKLGFLRLLPAIVLIAVGLVMVALGRYELGAVSAAVGATFAALSSALGARENKRTKAMLANANERITRDAR